MGRLADCLDSVCTAGTTACAACAACAGRTGFCLFSAGLSLWAPTATPDVLTTASEILTNSALCCGATVVRGAGLGVVVLGAGAGVVVVGAAVVVVGFLAGTRCWAGLRTAGGGRAGCGLGGGTLGAGAAWSSLAGCAGCGGRFFKLDGVVALLCVPLSRIHVEMRSDAVVLGWGSAVVMGALAFTAFFSSANCCCCSACTACCGGCWAMRIGMCWGRTWGSAWGARAMCSSGMTTGSATPWKPPCSSSLWSPCVDTVADTMTGLGSSDLRRSCICKEPQ